MKSQDKILHKYDFGFHVWTILCAAESSFFHRFDANCHISVVSSHQYKSVGYPLLNIQKTMENQSHFFMGKSTIHGPWAVVYQRAYTPFQDPSNIMKTKHIVDG